jgi:gluconokinase
MSWTGGLSGLSPTGHGLTVLPFWTGERAPGWAGDARGAISGFDFATKPEEVVLAVLEAVALRISLVYDHLRPTMGDSPRVCASGQALTDSAVWPRILSDALGLPVEIPKTEEAAARGAAVLALGGHGGDRRS